MQVLHLGLGYFKVILHVHIVFRARSSLKVIFSFKLAIPELILTFTNWIFGHSLQYLHPYLLLPTGILGHNCNTCTCTYFYQLGFWGPLTIPAFNTNIIILLVFCISHILCLLFGNNNNFCAILDFMCVLNT